METLLSFARSLAVGHRQAWIFALVGCTVLLFLNYDWWPLAGSGIVTAPIAGILVIWGLSVIIIDAADAIQRSWRRKAASYRQQREEARRNREERERINQQALANLEIVEGFELRQLLWAIRNNRRRFENPANGLRHKHIVEPAENDYRGNVWVVNEAVWDRREEIIEKHRKIPTESKFPEVRYSA